MRILLADDDALLLDLLKVVLSQEGHNVEVVNSAEDAFASFKPDLFDLVITDYLMPGKKGLELAKAIKTQTPNFPVILLTGSAEMIEDKEDLKYIDKIITKPCRLGVLNEAIMQFAQEHKTV